MAEKILDLSSDFSMSKPLEFPPQKTTTPSIYTRNRLLFTATKHYLRDNTKKVLIKHAPRPSNSSIFIGGLA